MSIDELQSWKVKELKEWLSQRGQKKSANKDVLVNRVYKGMNNCIDSDESSYISAPLSNDSEHVPIHLIFEI